MSEIEINKLYVDLENNNLLKNISLSLKKGELISLVGPNGAGKSTLLRAILGIQKIKCGTVTIRGKKNFTLSDIDRAKEIAYLPQKKIISWPNKIRDIVGLGRFPYGAKIENESDEDKKAIDQALVSCKIKNYENRRSDKLSGGELALVHCARAFATQAPIIIADEPTTSLDPYHELLIMNLLKSYVKNGRSAMIVMHNLGIAARYSDRMLWIKDGQIIFSGTPSETLTKDNINKIFSVEADVNNLTVEFKEIR